jgi:hypothetical protein
MLSSFVFQYQQLVLFIESDVSLLPMTDASGRMFI